MPAAHQGDTERLTEQRGADQDHHALHFPDRFPDHDHLPAARPHPVV
ncbi:hypothetical protein [Nocardioides zeae]